MAKTGVLWLRDGQSCFGHSYLGHYLLFWVSNFVLRIYSDRQSKRINDNRYKKRTVLLRSHNIKIDFTRPMGPVNQGGFDIGGLAGP